MPLILVIVLQYYNSLLSVTFSELYNITKLAKSFFFFWYFSTSPSAMSQREDPLAYGHYNPQDSARSGGSGGNARGLVGDTFKKLKETYKTHHGAQSHPQQAGQGQQQSYNSGGYGVCCRSDH